MMQKPTSPPVLSFLPTSFFLLVVGLGGLAYLFYNTQPTLWPLWLFFFLSVLAATGLALPVVAFLNRRFPVQPPATPEVVVREAIWCGIYAATLIWLRIPRVLTPAIALLLLAGLVLIEWLLRLRDRSQWKP